MKIKFKKLTENAVMPSKAHPTDAGFDVVATNRTYQGGCFVYSTGIALELPKDYVAFLFQRSSVSKMGLMLANCVGVIDSGYRGELIFKFRPLNDHPMLYNIGDKIGQIVIQKLPNIELVEAKELNKTERGDGGFGSTGK